MFWCFFSQFLASSFLFFSCCLYISINQGFHALYLGPAPFGLVKARSMLSLEKCKCPCQAYRLVYSLYMIFNMNTYSLRLEVWGQFHWHVHTICSLRATSNKLQTTLSLQASSGICIRLLKSPFLLLQVATVICRPIWLKVVNTTDTHTNQSYA